MGRKAIFPLLLAAVLLAGCARTAVPEQVPSGETRETQAIPDLPGLQEDLEALSAVPRSVGSDGEKEAVRYLERRFLEMGYDVTLQPYTNGAGETGANVIAVKPCSDPQGDILVFSAHHDSVPNAPGANDNASGAAVLLGIASALKDVPTDTELRFVSFTDEENGKLGSRAYTASLSEQERERIIGDIQLDMLGGLGSRGLCLCTMDGSPNYLTELLDPSLPLLAETASDHASFQLARIPAVLLTQQGRGYLYHTAADTPDQIDLAQLQQAVELVSELGRTIASPDTPSYRQTAREDAGNYVYRQTRQNVIYFGSSLADSEAYIGAVGIWDDGWTVEGDGWSDTYETYRYSMNWFGGDTPMNTYYTYRNGYLQSIDLRPEETGYTAQQVSALLREMYGEPASAGDNREGVYAEGWADEIYSKYITLTFSEPCAVTVSGYSVGITNVLASYPVEGGEALVTDAQDKRVWDYVCSVLPLDARQKIAEFNLFTDGCSNVLAYTSPVKREDGTSDNTRFSLNIDYYDVYDETGTPRDWSKLTYTILHEYGHVLLEDETQIDLTLGSGTHDPAGFIPGSFRYGFYDRFWKDLGITAVGDFEANPTHYVSRYGANYFHEDIADTFAVFVLGAKPDGDTVAEQKLLFFWANPDMTALRQEIRAAMGLD